MSIVDFNTLLVGFSGGADSCALLIYLLENQDFINVKKHAIYCHHHLRKEADAELEFCRQFATSLGYEFHEAHLNLNSLSNIETAARKARYDAYFNCLNSICTNPITESILVLGHHLDDRLETFFTRMTRGSNLSGLLAPREWSQNGHGIRVYRPLLHLKKSQIIDYLEANKVTYWAQDHTNEDNFCLRNKIRNQMITPLKESYPHAYSGMIATLSSLESDCNFLEKYATETFHRLAPLLTHLDRLAFSKEHNAIQIRLLRYFFEANNVYLIPNQALLMRVISLANETILEPKKAPLGKEYYIVALQHHFVIRPIFQYKID